ncbi:MAG: hypothetical protein JWM82_164 [Myxococcales bacterium]|nr:hypothetical protein [Myxococcales bacterium]
MRPIRAFSQRFTIALTLALCTGSLSGLPSGATAAAADKQLNGLEMKARESFAAGRYDEALQTFAKLYAETLHPVYLRNIGRCHQKMREPQKAIDAFQDYLAKTKTGKDKITPDERTEIEGYIKDMETLRDAPTAKPPEPVAAPVQPLNGTPNGNPNGTTTAAPILAQPAPQPASAANPTMIVSAPPVGESHPIYTRWWFWTGVGALVVGGVVAAVVLSGGSSREACPAGVSVCK